MEGGDFSRKPGSGHKRSLSHDSGADRLVIARLFCVLIVWAGTTCCLVMKTKIKNEKGFFTSLYAATRDIIYESGLAPEHKHTNINTSILR